MNKVTVNYKGKKVEIELTEEQVREIEKTIKVEKFIPTNDQRCYFVYKNTNNQYIIDYTEYAVDYGTDCAIIQNLPVFRTEAEAEVYKHYLEALDRYTFEPDWEDTEFVCIIEYSYLNKKLYVDEIKVVSVGKVPYFVTPARAQQFINEVGKDNVKRFMFDIWEE